MLGDACNALMQEVGFFFEIQLAFQPLQQRRALVGALQQVA